MKRKWRESWQWKDKVEYKPIGGTGRIPKIEFIACEKRKGGRKKTVSKTKRVP